MYHTAFKSDIVLHPMILGVLMLLCLILLSSCAAQKDLSFEAAYTIDADLNPEGRSMTYTETAEITNTGSDSTKELYFHIYGNTYKNLYKVEDGDITVTSVLDEAGNVLSYRRTQKGVLYRIKLAQPLAPGETAELTFACEIQIPDLAQKYGVSPDGDLQLPSFALQLAVYDKNGWDTEPVQEYGDGRYAAVADYTLTVRVPEAYTLACNGSQLSYETRDGTATYSFFAEKRRDLIIIACENYVPLERTVGSTTILGYFNETVNNVTPENMERVMEYAAFALTYFSQILVEYPYDTLVVTNAAMGSNFAVNMEYPGLITVYFDSEDASFSSQMETFHEVAHQWFYSLIGNDENHEPWLDEGFAAFAAGLCLEEAGVGNVDETYWGVYAISDTAMAGQAVNVAADKAEDYTFVIYHRGGMFLKHLMDAVGKEAFLSILSDYCHEQLYGIATTEDFLSALYAGTDADVTAIVDEYLLLSEGR